MEYIFDTVKINPTVYDGYQKICLISYADLLIFSNSEMQSMAGKDNGLELIQFMKGIKPDANELGYQIGQTTEALDYNFKN